jgi:oligosaccharide repeat unit polymerase
MLLLTSIALFFLIYINYRIGGRSAFYPAVVFCAVWAADILLLWFAGSYFLPLSATTLAIFTSGCLAFSGGSLVALMSEQKPAKQVPLSGGSNRNLNLFLILLLFAFPFYLRWIIGLASESTAATLLQAVRYATVDFWGNPPGYTLFMNLATLARIIALFSYFEGGPLRRAFAISLSVVFDLLMGARGSVVTFLCALVCLEWIKTRHLPWKVLVSFSLIFIFAFSLIAIEVGKGDARPDAPVAENAVAIGRGFVEYAAGGLVAFDHVVRNPNVVPHSVRIDRFLIETLNKLGAHFKLPDDYDMWIDIGPGLANVYTFYFAYIDFGYIGMMAIVFLLGLVITLFYKKAIRGSRISALIYSMLFAGIILSTFGENFFLATNFLSKLLVVYWLIYRLPAFWAKLFPRANPKPPILVPRTLGG